MNKHFLWLFLVLFPGCEPPKTYYPYRHIIQNECYYCQRVPTIQHIRVINEKESIAMYVCEKHLASYILEEPNVDFIKDE